MTKTNFSHEKLIAAGFPPYGGGRDGYEVEGNVAVITTFENQAWFLSDCLGGTHVLYKVDFSKRKTTILDKYEVSGRRFKYKNALEWYQALKKKEA